MRRRRAALAFLLVAAFGLALYGAGLSRNPPGFYLDESSIAYNAHLVATTGRDEHGEAWPLFFRAFGDYKNPTYIYLLAAVFKLTGPSILAARMTSAVLVVASALLLGLLAVRITGRRAPGLLVAATALLTPWLFQLGRVVLEVSLYPLGVAFLLWCVRVSYEKERWGWADAVRLALALALVTYSYSVGRLLGPLLALGLAFFVTRARASGIARAWALYVASLVPMLVFRSKHPGALTGRFSIITYVTPENSYAAIALEFLKHFAGNFDTWRLLVTGDPNVNQMATIYGTGPFLAGAFALSVWGAWLALRRDGWRDAWWRYVLYGLAASAVPASLTNEYFHLLRLAAVPIFLLLLTVPAFARLTSGGRRNGLRRAALMAAVASVAVQGAAFQLTYHAHAGSPRRTHLFDQDYPRVTFPAALAHPSRPVYLYDAPYIPGYVQALWHATLRGVPTSEFVRLPADQSPPPGAVVITTKETCDAPCRVLATDEPYVVYVAEGEPQSATGSR